MMLASLTDYLSVGSKLTGSQKIRLLTEAWVADHVFCPACGGVLVGFRVNLPVADFECDSCRQQYELKSKAGRFGRKVVDGAYDTMV